MFKKLCAALILGLGLTTGALAQDINFGMISTEATQNLKADWQPLLDDMAKQTGLKINVDLDVQANQMVDMVRNMHADRFDDLVASNALIRPGPLDAGMHKVYCRRKKGEEQVTYALRQVESARPPSLPEAALLSQFSPKSKVRAWYGQAVMQ